MNIGFIGAGKVGFSMGKFLTQRNINVTGYYSRSPESAKEAADFTETEHYTSMQSLAADSDVIFLTVPDGQISAVWEQLKELPIQNKIIIHCSGSLSSAVFSDIRRVHAFGYSIHPLYAINDKYRSYLDLAQAFFTLEGDSEHLDALKAMFEGFGNHTAVITAEDKVRYHGAAAMISNLYVGLVEISEEVLRSCGFSPEDAHRAMLPLMLGNTQNIADYGTVGALTGPIERNDVSTVHAHLTHMTEEEQQVYRCLSRQVLKTAKRKHPTRDYSVLEEEIDQ